jgi:hypothetical protein
MASPDGMKPLAFHRRAVLIDTQQSAANSSARTPSGTFAVSIGPILSGGAITDCRGFAVLSASHQMLMHRSINTHNVYYVK